MSATANYIQSVETDIAAHRSQIGFSTWCLTGFRPSENIRQPAPKPATVNATAEYSLLIYYGSRAAQPAWVRRFLDLAVERLTNSSEFVLTTYQLNSANMLGVRALSNRGIDYWNSSQALMETHVAN